MTTLELQKIADLISCPLPMDTSVNTCKVKEQDRSAKLKEVTLKYMDSEAFFFSPEIGKGKAGVMSPLLAKSGVHNATCDAVAILVTKQGKYIVLIELKSDRPKGYREQFHSTRCFIEYIRILLKEFHMCNLDNYQYRYLLLTTSQSGRRPLDKTTTTYRKNCLPKSEIQVETVKNGQKISITRFL